MSRKVYRVMPDGTRWVLKNSGISLGTYLFKSVAIEAGRKIARENQPSQLVIYLSDGKIETEYTYGNDPHPPRG